MLHEFLTEHREELIARTREKVASRGAPPATEEELTKDLPIFLAQLTEALRLHESVTRAAIGKRAAAHGRDLSRMGLTVAQVVHEYGDVCEAVTELAVERRASITSDEFHTLHRCLEDAIAEAVTEYATQKELALSRLGTQRLGFFAHELRNLLATATLSFDMMRKGEVGIRGGTSAVHQRALEGLHELVSRLLAELRLEAGIEHREPLSVRAFIDEVEAAASLEAVAHGHRLTVVTPAESDLVIEADRQVLASVVFNLLHNAFKFSHPRSNVVLRAHAAEGSVSIDVEDECGGLPAGMAQELFRPFAQRGVNRAGLGLGLSISHEGARAHCGVLEVRDVPGHGCVFTVQLPRRSSTER